MMLSVYTYVQKYILRCSVFKAICFNELNVHDAISNVNQMGAIRAGKRDFELHALPETAATRRRSAIEPLRVLVTWSDFEQKKEDETTEVIVLDPPDESETALDSDYASGERSSADEHE